MPKIIDSPAPRSPSTILAIGALGVVFGDIGTSPLYAFSQIFAGTNAIPVIHARVLGALSMIFWTLTLIVSMKYVLIVMRADNQGEGGVMALATLASSSLKKLKAGSFLMLLGVIGAALFYGDGMITPAISVLSAVEGLSLVAPSLTKLVIPISLLILITLFAVQKFGTSRVGIVFGPIMFLWFIIIGILGAISLAQTPEVLKSISPIYAISFFQGEPTLAFLSLASVVLCVTGAEALYADMGQFGRFPIRFSWFAVAAPALYLNYLGQGALVLRDPTAVTNSFYLLVPHSCQIPMILFATIATVIASQAVISGAFSMTHQAIRLGYLPRMTITHTSANEGGQIYVPAVNWMLMFSVIGIILGFQHSVALASAYGIAVTGTFVITSLLVAVLARQKWKVSLWIVIPISLIFLIIDCSFFIANLTKFDHGGWFPLAIAALLATAMLLWQWGRKRLASQMATSEISLENFHELVASEKITKVPNTAVYLTFESGIPLALSQRISLMHVFDETTVIIRLHTADVPRVDPQQRLTVRSGVVIDVDVHYGFMERPSATDIMKILRQTHPQIIPEECLYIFFDARVTTSGAHPFRELPAQLFAFMQRNSSAPQRYFDLPPEQVIEFSSLVRF